MNDRLPSTPPLRDKKVRATPKGRRVDAQALADVRALLGDAPRRRDLLIEHLHKIQDRFGCLADRHLVALAQEMKLAMTEVYEVATFYHHFDVIRDDEAAPPAITVRVCDSIACELAGAGALLDRLPKLLGADVRVLAAPCIGRCEQAPAAVVGRHPVACATVERIQALVRRRDVEHPPARDTARFSPAAYVDPKNTPGAALDPSPAYVGYDSYRAAGGYRLIADCLAGKHAPEKLIETMEHSGLRGLGGAGFPTGRKWRIVRAEPQPKVLALNIDEGEPGTFKDRVYLERDPHRFIEGMLVAAWAVEAGACYVYLRDEYHGCRAILERELARLKADPPCALPPIDLRRGAGAYICGEESAMIESIEGKRGMPRLRPPYVAQVGLFGYPTLEHNLETVFWVRDIVERGPEWFAGFGRNGRKGLRSFSVSGRVKKPGDAPRPGRDLGARADRRVLRRHARRPHALRLSPGRRVGRHPARVARARAARLRHAAAVRLPDRLGGGRAALGQGPRGGRGAEPDAVLQGRIVRAVHAVPRRDGEGARADGGAEMGRRAPHRTLRSDDGRIDLRAGAGRPEPGADGAEVLPG